MIYIDGYLVEPKHFPDGTFANRIEPNKYEKTMNITWLYDNDGEMTQIYFITKHLKSHNNEVTLYMPYLPHARMDRVKNFDEVFTLKYFCEFINSLGFKEVIIRDPHSNIGVVLLDRVTAYDNSNYIFDAISIIEDEISNGASSINSYTNYIKDKLALFYPDEGAMKRYTEQSINIPFAFGIKNRHWRTGEILGLKIVNEENVIGRDVLIVDDICSRGGTFIASAKALKEAGAKDIYLLVTHCENTILEGDLLKGDLIKKVYTSNSIYRSEHEKVEIILS